MCNTKIIIISLLIAMPSLAEPSSDPNRVHSGGSTTVFNVSRTAFTHPAKNLTDDDRRGRFFVGNSFFKKNWVVAPASTEGRDGLGPLFNARSCSSCHLQDGRGQPPVGDEQPVGLLFRLSIQGDTPHGDPKGHAVYGGQFAPFAIPGIKGEGNVIIEEETIQGAYPDGTTYELRRSVYRFEDLNYGPLEDVMVSPRVTPAVIGMGLLELIPEETLHALADPDDLDNDGISGRMNTVWDVSSQTKTVGRFGWKANQPTVAQQVAGAFVGDIGITSSLFPQENHSPVQQLEEVPNGGEPELNDEVFADIVLYTQTLAVPARRDMDDPTVLRGEQLFHEISCVKCHSPTLKTGVNPELPELSAQTIYPFTDLLLHDMGDELADGRPDFEATGNEWRTPPLWGIGLVKTVNNHTRFLHDGRAHGLEEAILWHGGEAKQSKEAFMALPLTDRAAIIRFLKSL